MSKKKTNSSHENKKKRRHFYPDPNLGVIIEKMKKMTVHMYIITAIYFLTYLKSLWKKWKMTQTSCVSAKKYPLRKKKKKNTVSRKKLLKFTNLQYSTVRTVHTIKTQFLEFTYYFFKFLIMFI